MAYSGRRSIRRLLNQVLFGSTPVVPKYCSSHQSGRPLPSVLASERSRKKRLFVRPAGTASSGVQFVNCGADDVSHRAPVRSCQIGVGLHLIGGTAQRVAGHPHQVGRQVEFRYPQVRAVIDRGPGVPCGEMAFVPVPPPGGAGGPLRSIAIIRPPRGADAVCAVAEAP